MKYRQSASKEANKISKQMKSFEKTNRSAKAY